MQTEEHENSNQKNLRESAMAVYGGYHRSGREGIEQVSFTSGMKG